MNRIASTHELTIALREILAEASSPNPSRHRLAAKLASLSVRVAGESPVLDAAEKAIQGIARALGSGWRVKESDFYDNGYVGEVWADDTSYFKIRVELDEHGAVDIDPWAYLNASRAAQAMAYKVFNKLDVKGTPDQIARVLQSAPKVAVEALEAGTTSEAALDAAFKELKAQLADVAANVQPKLAKNGWALESGFYGSHVGPHDMSGKAAIDGSASLEVSPPGDSKAATKARKIIADAAKTLPRQYVMTLPGRVFWSQNKLQVPFVITFA